MDKRFELSMVMMPNFISMKMPPRPRQEGFAEAPKIPIEDLTEEEAHQYAEEMKQAFIKHWFNKKHQPKTDKTQYQ